MIHEPRCADWRAHVSRCVEVTLDADDWPSLSDFADELRASWADEQLLSDPATAAVYDDLFARLAEATAG